jgi:hypothetical protein
MNPATTLAPSGFMQFRLPTSSGKFEPKKFEPRFQPARKTAFSIVSAGVLCAALQNEEAMLHCNEEER